MRNMKHYWVTMQLCSNNGEFIGNVLGTHILTYIVPPEPSSGLAASIYFNYILCTMAHSSTHFIEKSIKCGNFNDFYESKWEILKCWLIN
jgi:hypothetical protein